MCGIFGFMFKKEGISSEQRGALLTVLAFGNAKRGDDSWGFWNGSRNEVTRGLGSIEKGIHRVFNSKYGFGHTRKGTCGAITIPNAHPFEIGDIVGAHNGMIMNHSELNTKYKREHEVDSMHIFSHLNESRGLDDIRGYGAIEWMKKNSPGKIYLCRLSGGDLSIRGIAGPDGKEVGIVWSSDDNHLKTALMASGFDSSEYQVEQNKVFLVEGGELFKTDKTLQLAERFSQESSYSWEDGYGHGRRYFHGGSTGLSTRGAQTEEKKESGGTTSKKIEQSDHNARLLAEWRAIEAKRVSQANSMRTLASAPTDPVDSKETTEINVPSSLNGRVNLDLAIKGDLQLVGTNWVGIDKNTQDWYIYDNSGNPISIIVE